MNRKNTRVRVLSLALALPAAFLAGCSSDDSGTNPGVTVPVTPADAAAATTAISGINNTQFTFGVDQVVAGNVTGLPRDGAGGEGAVWNSTTMRWEYVTSYSMEGYSQEFSWYAQYLNGTSVVSGGPTPADDASGANRTIYETEQHSSSTGGKFPAGSSDYHSHMDISQTPGRGGPTLYTISGDGDMTVNGSFQGVPASFTASWTTDLSRAVPNGCPSGTVVYTVGQFTVTTTYDGQGAFTWVMTEGGTPVPGEEGTGGGTIFGCSAR